MKRLFFILICFAFWTTSSAQDSSSQAQESYYQILMDSSSDRIDYGCGWGGHYSENLWIIHDLIIYKRFDLISKLLDSPTPSTSYLAAVALLRANKKKRIPLDSITDLKLKALKNDPAKISFCSGCTGHWHYSISHLLTTKERSSMAIWTRHWIDDSLNNKSRFRQDW